MKIIILIIADDTKQYYIDMQNIWKKYMNTHKQIKSYFIKFSQTIENNIIDEENNTIWIKGIETYIPGILDKTIKSFEHLIKNNIEFDYVIRTNLSTIVLLDNLYNYLLTNPTDYAGPIGIIPKKEIKNNIHYDKIDMDNKFFPSGTCIILSKNTINILLNDKIYY